MLSLAMLASALLAVLAAVCAVPAAVAALFAAVCAVAALVIAEFAVLCAVAALLTPVLAVLCAPSPWLGLIRSRSVGRARRTLTTSKLRSGSAQRGREDRCCLWAPRTPTHGLIRRLAHTPRRSATATRAET